MPIHFLLLTGNCWWLKLCKKTDCKVCVTYILTTVDDKPLSRYLQFMFDFSCETDSVLEEDFQQRIQALEEVRVTRHNLCFLSNFFLFFVCLFFQCIIG